MRAWLFQDYRQKKKLGDKAPWSVGWVDPEGRRRSKRIGSRSMAEKFQRRIEGQLAAGIYQSNTNNTWKHFRDQFERDVLTTKSAGARTEYAIAFNHFERLVKPAKLMAIKTSTIDHYKALRVAEGSKRRPGKKVAAATVNKELRHLKAALRKACKWEYMARPPEVEMLREPEREVVYATAENFTALYEAAATLKRPKGLGYLPRDWWRALLAFAYLTGWRVGEILDLRREQVDLEARIAQLKAEQTKGRRAVRIDLHPVIIAHLREIQSFAPVWFPWPHHMRTLWSDFSRLKKAAGVNFDGAFHRLRFGFATMNRHQFDERQLQHLMRHKSAQTTRRYINFEADIQRTAEKVYVPDVLKPAVG